MAIIKSHGPPAMRPRAAGGGRRVGVGGGSGGSDRIGADLTKTYFLMKNAVFGQFSFNFGHFWTFWTSKMDLARNFGSKNGSMRSEFII